MPINYAGSPFLPAPTVQQPQTPVTQAAAPVAQNQPSLAQQPEGDTDTFEAILSRPEAQAALLSMGLTMMMPQPQGFGIGARIAQGVQAGAAGAGAFREREQELAQEQFDAETRRTTAEAFQQQVAGQVQQGQAQTQLGQARLDLERQALALKQSISEEERNLRRREIDATFARIDLQRDLGYAGLGLEQQGQIRQMAADIYTASVLAEEPLSLEEAFAQAMRFVSAPTPAPAGGGQLSSDLADQVLASLGIGGT